MAPAEIGYAAMLEQFAPRELVDLCVAAEAAGFSGVMAADHVQPWVPQQGEAAFVCKVYLHNVGRNQSEWIDVFGREVLPKLTR